jgi:two-component system sensor histidine kinase RegB
VHLRTEPEERGPEAKRLREDGFELVLALKGSEEELGVVLVSERADQRPYLAYERRFAAGLAGEAGLALHNARLADDLAAAHVKATLAHVAIGFVHNVRKKVDWIAAAARDLAARGPSTATGTNEAEEIRILATDATEQMTRFLKDATEESPTSDRTLALDSLLERCARLRAPDNEWSRITVDVEAEVQWCPVNEALEGVLVNLVENALNASEADRSVRVEARRAGDMLEISVIDHGCGMEPDVLKACEELWFTTRGRTGGHGVGLAFCKEVAARLGGSLALESELGVGTRATVRVPAPLESRSGAS